MDDLAIKVGRADQRVRQQQEDLDRLAAEIRELTVLDEPTPEQDARLQEVMKEYRDGEQELERRKTRYDMLEQAASIPENRTRGDGTDGNGTGGEAARTNGPTFVRRSKGDPYNLAEAESVRNSDGQVAYESELRSRAYDAIVQAPEYVKDEHRQAAVALIDGTRGTSRDEMGRKIDWRAQYAEYMLRHGSPAYEEAFFNYLGNGRDGLSSEDRTALSTVSANGGYMIPFYLDPTIILNNTGTVNPIRQMARVETIPTNVWHGISSAGVTATYQTEGATVSEGSPTFAQPTCTPQRATAYVVSSFELTQDSNIAAQVGDLFADAKDRLESTKFISGAGDASNEPLGIVTRLQQVTASRINSVTNGAFVSTDVIALINNLPPRWQQNASWLGHWFTANLVRQQVLVNNPTAVAGGQWADFGVGVPGTLLGRPFYQTSEMKNAAGTIGLSGATSSNDDILIIGDFRRGMIVVDRVGMEIVYNPLVLSSATATPTGQVGWYAIWRSSSNVLVDDAFRMLRV